MRVIARAEFTTELTVLADCLGGRAIALRDRGGGGAGGDPQRPRLGRLVARGFDCGNACPDCGLAVDTDRG